MSVRGFFVLLVVCGVGCARDAGREESKKPAVDTVAKGDKAGEDAKKSEPSVKKVEPPRPTVFPAFELVKVLDVSKLPVPEGAKVGHHHAASLQAQVPGKVADLFELYGGQLKKLGWQAKDEGRMNTEEYASATFAKDEHLAFLSLFKMEKEALVSVVFHGNFDTRTLPKRDGSSWVGGGGQTVSIYASDHKVADEAKWVAQQLTASGWQEFTGLGASRATVSDSSSMNFRKQGYQLAVFVTTAPALGNKTSVQYSVRALGHELPAPAEAAKVEFDDERWKMRCEVAGDLKSIGGYYQKAMPGAGYLPLPGEAPQPTYWNLRFGTAGEDVIMVTLTNKDGKTTRVEVTGIPAAVMKKLKEKG